MESDIKQIIDEYIKLIKSDFLTKEAAFEALITKLKNEDLFDFSLVNDYKEYLGIKSPEIGEEYNDDETSLYWELPKEDDSDFKVGLSNGWVTESLITQIKISQSQIVFNENMGFPPEVTSDIFRSAIQILGRLNCPIDWETTASADNFDFWKSKTKPDCRFDNKKGLVYGQVQSGKTASMLMLTQVALESGYNFIIHLSSDKESLRKQTQSRIDSLFKRHNGESSFDFNIYSPTQVADYLDCFDRDENVLVKYDALRTKSVVLCIKKNINHLKQLRDDLSSLKYNFEQFELNTSFEEYIKCLIIDDEADYASQNTSRHGLTAINDVLTSIRKLLSKNSYVGYTATPQACFGAKKSALIGYPSDFVYPITPFRKNGKTSYTGARDFFLNENSEYLITKISEDAWPFWNKESGRANGIYDPNSGNIVVERLRLLEKDFLEELIIKEDKSITASLVIKTIKTFLLSTAVLWHRHCEDYGIDSGSLTKEKIDKRNISNSKITGLGFPEFPFSAMMFNVVVEKSMQSSFRKYISKLLPLILKEYKEYKYRYFQSEYDKQVNKSLKVNSRKIPSLETLSRFIDYAVEIALCDTVKLDPKNVIYLLNSSDEGQNIDYSNGESNYCPKTASIFVGGLLLGRGITLEGLNTTVFLRSQSSSMMDTNLQMCRWFGHKRSYLDLCSVFMQDHNRLLFSEIARCDEKARNKLIVELRNGAPNKNVVNTLFASELFRLTSPNKQRSLVRVAASYTGKESLQLRSCKTGDDWRTRSTKYISKLNELVQLGFTVESMHNRAFVMRNLSFENVRDLAKLLPENTFDFEQFVFYLVYLKEQIDNEISFEINLGIFGASFINGVFILGETEDVKRGITVEGKTSVSRRAFDLNKNILKRFEGGKSQGSYAGDKYVDLNSELHEAFINNKMSARDLSQHGALLNIYFLDANYLDKDNILNEDHEDFSRDGMVAFILNMSSGGTGEEAFVNESEVKNILMER